MENTDKADKIAQIKAQMAAKKSQAATDPRLEEERQRNEALNSAAAKSVEVEKAAEAIQRGADKLKEGAAGAATKLFAGLKSAKAKVEQKMEGRRAVTATSQADDTSAALANNEPDDVTPDTVVPAPSAPEPVREECKVNEDQHEAEALAHAADAAKAMKAAQVHKLVAEREIKKMQALVDGQPRRFGWKKIAVGVLVAALAAGATGVTYWVVSHKKAEKVPKAPPTASIQDAVSNAPTQQAAPAESEPTPVAAAPPPQPEAPVMDDVVSPATQSDVPVAVEPKSAPAEKPEPKQERKPATQNKNPTAKAPRKPEPKKENWQDKANADLDKWGNGL